jgi:hypothetical protein
MALIVPVLRRLAPEGELRADGEYYMLNPRRADRRLGSFKFNVTSGAWSDFAVDGGEQTEKASGRWPASLIAYVEDITYGEAFLRLEALLGLRPWGQNFNEKYRPLTEEERAAAPPAPARKSAASSAYIPLVIPAEREPTIEAWLRRVYRAGPNSFGFTATPRDAHCSRWSGGGRKADRRKRSTLRLAGRSTRGFPMQRLIGSKSSLGRRPGRYIALTSSPLTQTPQ